MDKTQEIHHKLKEVRDIALAHAEEATDPKCAALCSTAGEVLAALEQSYDNYLDKTSKAWQ